MANEVWTSVQINGGSPESVKKVGEIFDNEKIKDKTGTEWLARTLYDEIEDSRTWMYEHIGPKWCEMEDYLIFEDYIEFSTRSAWDYPDIYLKKLLETILKIDEDFEIVVQFDDEMPNFVGAAYGNKNGYTDEFDHDVDRPSEEDFEDEDGEYDDDAYDEALERFHYDMDDVKDELLSECKSSLKDKVITE